MKPNPNSKEYRIKGPYRILNFTSTSRPIYVVHGVYKKLIKDYDGSIPLAGNPAAIDLEVNVKFDMQTFWKGKAVEKLSDLDNYPIKSLAPGIVNVNGLRSPFLFYGNCWFQVDQTVVNREEKIEEEDSQLCFMSSIDKMEKQHTANTHTLKRKR